MKILGNIIPAIKLYDSLKYLTPHRKAILAAKTAEDFEKERENILKATDTWGNCTVKVFGIKLNIIGRENLPERGPVVFVSNHQGYADIFVCCAALNRFQFAFVAKNDLEKIPLYGKWIRRIRSVMIQRNDARASLKAIDEGIELIHKGFSLLVFPEGTRSKGGPIGEFKRGSLRLATKPGVPVIPITIEGSYHAFEETGCVKSGAPVTLVIHPLIETKGMDKQQANELTAVVEKIIREEHEKLVRAEKPV